LNYKFIAFYQISTHHHMPPRAQSPQNPEQGEKKVTKDPLGIPHYISHYIS